MKSMFYARAPAFDRNHWSKTKELFLLEAITISIQISGRKSREK